MKISFCTTCMNRLFHLKETYLKSIENTSSYSNREFVLLNYNSKDEIDDWVKNNLLDHIKLGLVAYYKTTEPENFIATHAKNICYKLATGDIICNLDVDNFLVENYCEKICELFGKNNNIIIASNPRDKNENIGTCGMILCRKDHFYSVSGYDENINSGWGMDDTNFQYRCRMQNELELVILDKEYTNCISHDNSIRTKYFKDKNIIRTHHSSLEITRNCAKAKQYVANNGMHWGKAKLIKNFSEQIEI